MDAVWLFLILLRASFLSVSGQTALPLLRHDLIAAGLATNQQVIEALSIGQLGTGPGGLFMVALGYFSVGWLGAVAAVVAIVLPPLLVVPMASYLRPRLGAPRINGTIRGVSLATSGLVVATAVNLMTATVDGQSSQAWPWLVLLGAVAVGLWARPHPLWIMLAGAAVGLLLQGR